MKTVVKSRLVSGLEDPGHISYNDQLNGIKLSLFLFTVALSYQALQITWSRFPGVIPAVRKAEGTYIIIPRKPLLLTEKLEVQMSHCPPSTMLLWWLRAHRGLTGKKALI